MMFQGVCDFFGATSLFSGVQCMMVSHGMRFQGTNPTGVCVLPPKTFGLSSTVFRKQ